ncbi:unnamed protein product [Rhodiola kirilowii]
MLHDEDELNRRPILQSAAPAILMAKFSVIYHCGGSGSIQIHKNGVRHQCTASESVVIDDQPPWLDDLLDEPETPVRKGFRCRSSSDSFASLATEIQDMNLFT